MSLLVYNLTAAPLVLANGLLGVPKTTIPASTSGAGVRGEPWYASGDELEGLDATAYAALQLQQTSGLVAFEWSDAPEYDTYPLYVASAQLDVADLDVNLYSDPATGLDSNPGTLAAPLQTFEALMNAKPPVYQRALQFHLNIDPTTSALNTTKKTYTLSSQTLRFLFPEASGDFAESVLVVGGFTNELGDKTAIVGSTDILLTTAENLVADAYKGAQLTIVSGTGAGQVRLIRSNSAGPNSTITPEGMFTTIPDNTSVFRIGVPNVQIEFSSLVLFAAPPQNLFMQGIEFVYTGGGGDDFQIGNVLGTGGGGATVFTGCAWNLNNGGSKANFRVRGTARAQFNGDATYWVGPNNPFTDEDGLNGCYIHGSQALSSNVGGQLQGTGCLIQNTGVQARSFSAQVWNACTFENAPIQITNCATFDLFSLDPTQRSRVRLRTGTAVTVAALGFSTAPNASQPGFNNVEFSDITGDLFVLQDGATGFLGDITVAGVNTGFGLRVRRGASCQVSATTGLTGAAGAIKLDADPTMTLAQVLAAPFGGTLRSNTNPPYPVVAPLIVAAATIAPATVLAHVTGATIIQTITPPYVGFIGDITLIPDDVGGFNTNTGGNIAAASAAVQFKALKMTFDGTSWYPSYT